jgi:hypothetical protein
MENKKDFEEGTFDFGRCTVMVSIDNGKWHLSISTPSAAPCYKEIKAARYKFIPDNIFMAQIFPPKADFVNVHPFCFHLFQIEI